VFAETAVPPTRTFITYLFTCIYSTAQVRVIGNALYSEVDADAVAHGCQTTPFNRGYWQEFRKVKKTRRQYEKMQDRAFNMCMLVLLQSFLETGYTCSLSLLLPRMTGYRPVLLHSANSGEFRVV